MLSLISSRILLAIFRLYTAFSRLPTGTPFHFYPSTRRNPRSSAVHCSYLQSFTSVTEVRLERATCVPLLLGPIGKREKRGARWLKLKCCAQLPSEFQEGGHPFREKDKQTWARLERPEGGPTAWRLFASPSTFLNQPASDRVECFNPSPTRCKSSPFPLQNSDEVT